MNGIFCNNCAIDRVAQGHNSMETMSTPRQDMLVGALEGFLEDLPSS